VTQRYVAYSEARAAGGAALILLESMYVHPAGQNTATSSASTMTIWCRATGGSSRRAIATAPSSGRTAFRGDAGPDGAAMRSTYGNDAAASWRVSGSCGTL
jgi:hypothetical protein